MLVADAKLFGVRLRELRMKQGWSMYRLAKVADVSKQTVADIESGKTDPTLDTVCKLANALGVPLGASARPAPGVGGRPQGHDGSLL